MTMYQLTEYDKKRCECWKEALKSKNYSIKEQLLIIVTPLEWNENELKKAMQAYYLTLD